MAHRSPLDSHLEQGCGKVSSDVHCTLSWRHWVQTPMRRRFLPLGILEAYCTSSVLRVCKGKLGSERDREVSATLR